MREARREYFAANRFGDDGGYGSAWVDFELGGVPFPFPNTPARVRAVRYHDLHHVLTGYATDFVGELEISGWEIGAGCGAFVAAWVLNLAGMGAGVLRAPRRTFTAFVRGRRSRSLYGRAFEPLLDQEVGALRRMHVGDVARASAVDALLFVLAAAAGVAVASFLFLLVTPLVPLGLLLGASRKRSVAKG